MQLALPQLQAHLQKGLRSLYTLHGDEALLVQEAQMPFAQQRDNKAIPNAACMWCRALTLIGAKFWQRVAP
jgi:hypothetical protein